MLLQNDFYHIINIQQNSTLITAEIKINATHKIFEGHFPNQPVVPGVCMLQIVKEVLELTLNKETNIKQVDEMKFLTVINPQQNNIVQVQIKYTTDGTHKISFTASICKGETVYFKCKGNF